MSSSDSLSSLPPSVPTIIQTQPKAVVQQPNQTAVQQTDGYDKASQRRSERVLESPLSTNINPTVAKELKNLNAIKDTIDIAVGRGLDGAVSQQTSLLISEQNKLIAKYKDDPNTLKEFGLDKDSLINNAQQFIKDMEKNVYKDGKADTLFNLQQMAMQLLRHPEATDADKTAVRNVIDAFSKGEGIKIDGINETKLPDEYSDWIGRDLKLPNDIQKYTRQEDTLEAYISTLEPGEKVSTKNLVNMGILDAKHADNRGVKELIDSVVYSAMGDSVDPIAPRLMYRLFTNGYLKE